MVLSLIFIVSLIALCFALYRIYLQTSFTTKASVNPKFTNQKNAFEFVFECEGVKYYKFANELNIPVDRAFSAMDIYNELELKVDSEYLNSYFEAIIKACNEGKLTDVVLLTQIAKRKTEHITNVDLLYKLASVLYFSEEENPEIYDYAIAKKKIESWKRQKDITAFFLQMPISDLIPSFNSSEMSLELYTLLQRKELLQGLEFHLSTLQSEGKESELVTSLKAQISELQNLIAIHD